MSDATCFMDLATNRRRSGLQWKRLDATPLEHGDIAYEFEVIDGFRVQMILWAGDDEFPPSSQILFSDNFPIAFQAEDMAVVGDISITMIKHWHNKIRILRMYYL